VTAVTTATTALEVRQALAAALRVIPGLNAQPYLLGNLMPPTAVVTRGPIAYDQAFQGGVHTWTFIVRAFVASVTDIGAQTLLDEFLSAEGERSVKAAIEADTSLGGIVSDLHVTGASGEQEFVREGGGPLLFSEWTVEVWL